MLKHRCLTRRPSQPPWTPSVPLARFTSLSGGGSAFYVRRSATIMKMQMHYALSICLLFSVVSALATSIARRDIKSKGTLDGTTTHSNVLCTLKRDVANQLSGTVVLTGDLETGWVSVDVIKNGITLYSGADIAGLKHDKHVKMTSFSFEIHKDAVKESKVVIGSYHSAILTLPLNGVKITGTARD